MTISWTEMKTSKEVLQMIGEKRILIQMITERKKNLFFLYLKRRRVVKRSD